MEKGWFLTKSSLRVHTKMGPAGALAGTDPPLLTIWSMGGNIWRVRKSQGAHIHMN